MVNYRKFLCFLCLGILLSLGLKAQTGYSWLLRPHALQSLDSLLHQSPSMGLKTTFYPHGFLDSLLQQPKSMLSSDSLALEKKIQNLAQAFFEDLSFGNPRPTFKFQGYVFELRKNEVRQLMDSYLKNQSIVSLVNYLNNSSPEVKSILALLQLKQDSLVSNPTKIAQLTLSANHYRWLHHIRKNQMLTVVNIPAAQLKVYQGNQVALKMRVVLGRPARPTRVLTAQIKNVIINPNWYVPRSIATEELLPEIQKNIRYFYASHLDLLDKNNQVIDAKTVDWKALSKNYFPYTFRQKTGVWNTLGILKIPFVNPYRLYLHDTSEKKLFASSKRFFSHGCIRLEDPIRYAKLLLGPNSRAMDTLKIEGPYYNIPSKWIKVNKTAPLIIWYNLIDFDEKGEVVYLENIYK
ncbi:L,D-transpeptidase family protein [Aquirufa ecclesiirivi]|uniref:L,D-transpeptidase family protein n=1 Tax=Aquirufa ecclesiirivi TaxID=2715124 RepID=UPI0023D800F4|nr:L,D-transpeptidase family protein [Aquirufa ecclesiirivi]MDF0693178.1 L,D-transpeptidase family protein [Aquirufa ecclesiirivi]